MPSLVFVVVGIVTWVIGYNYSGYQEVLIQLPKWLKLLLVRPHTKYFNVWGVGAQIFGYLLVIGALGAWLIVPEVGARRIILFGWFAILMVGFAIWLFLAENLFK